MPSFAGLGTMFPEILSQAKRHFSVYLFREHLLNTHSEQGKVRAWWILQINKLTYNVNPGAVVHAMKASKAG